MTKRVRIATEEHRCEFPGCAVVEGSRSALDLHHIVPVCMGGTNAGANRIYLCPSHHRKVFVPECPSGHHSISHMDSIVIVGYLASSDGKVLHYKDPAGLDRYWCYRLGANHWN